MTAIHQSNSLLTAHDICDNRLPLLSKGVFLYDVHEIWGIEAFKVQVAFLETSYRVSCCCSYVRHQPSSAPRLVPGFN